MANEQEKQQVEQVDPIVASAAGNEPTISVEEQEAEGAETSEAVDWEAEAKKFQSMYDKKTAEYENFNQEAAELQQLKNLLAERPDVVRAMESALTDKSDGTNKSNDEIVSQEAFDPWDAYYKPDSPSYKMRVKREQELVHETVDQEIGKLQQTMAVNNLKNELKSRHKMSDDEAADFIQFATTPRGDLPLDTLIKVYRERDGKKVNENKKAVEKAQSIPQSAGVLQGGEAPQKGEKDQVWDRIMNAGSIGRIAKK
jgi:hypothetical protein|tara:strand:- start:553 stop:1320 length:768 start_codon:yes stop_codon:yes gene_type:complete